MRKPVFLFRSRHQKPTREGGFLIKVLELWNISVRRINVRNIDPDKAQVIAEAGNFDRTEATKFEKYAEEALSPSEKSDYRMYAKIAREEAKMAEAEVEREYDANRNSQV